jgi:uncharacterized protein
MVRIRARSIRSRDADRASRTDRDFRRAMKAQLWDETAGRLVCERCTIARDPLGRMMGLLGRRGLHDGEGLLMQPAASIHTFFMRFPIDAVFLDRELRVIKVVHDLRPWRAAAARRARAVLELGAGEAARLGLTPGALLSVVTAD